MNDMMGYEDIVAKWGYEVVASEVFGSYQGDVAVLLKNNDQWGWLVIGYGSCSGCDELQALDCDENWNPLPSALKELSDRLRSEIRWKSAQDMRDWLGDDEAQKSYWSWYEEDYPGFVAKAKSLIVS